MTPGLALILAAVLAATFVPLALTEKRSFAIRLAYALTALLLALSLGVLFTSLGFERPVRPFGGRPAVERATLEAPAAIEVDVAIRWAARGFGGWLAILAAGELLRLVLKRPAGVELLGPAVLFLAGAVLLDPQWGTAVAFAVSLSCVAVVGVWGRAAEPSAAPDSGHR